MSLIGFAAAWAIDCGFGERGIIERCAHKRSARLGYEQRRSARRRPARSARPCTSPWRHPVVPPRRRRTTAMSISLRGMKRRYAAPEFVLGRRDAETHQELAAFEALSCPARQQNFSTGTLRVPLGPAISHVTSSAINTRDARRPPATALHRLPPRLARSLESGCRQSSSAASINPGYAHGNHRILVDRSNTARRRPNGEAHGGDRSSAH